VSDCALRAGCESRDAARPRRFDACLTIADGPRLESDRGRA
jgi:hypothetical protein